MLFGLIFLLLAGEIYTTFTLPSSGMSTSWFASTVLLSAVGFYMWPHTFSASCSAQNKRVFRRNAIFMPLYQLILLFVFFAGFAAVLVVPGLKGADADLSLLRITAESFPPVVRRRRRRSGCTDSAGPRVAAADVLGDLPGQERLPPRPSPDDRCPGRPPGPAAGTGDRADRPALPRPPAHRRATTTVWTSGPRLRPAPADRRHTRSRRDAHHCFSGGNTLREPVTPRWPEQGRAPSAAIAAGAGPTYAPVPCPLLRLPSPTREEDPRSRSSLRWDHQDPPAPCAR